MNKDLDKLTEAYLDIRRKKIIVNEVVFPDTSDIPVIRRHTTAEQQQTNLTVTNKKILTIALDNAYGTKHPLLIFGAPGISKSDSVLQFAKKQASISQSSSGGNREFKYWNQCTEEEQNQILQSPGEYFVLFDVRTVRYDPTDITGVPVPIPDAIDKNILRTVKYSWIVALCKQEIDGILFFDEINQGSQAMLNLLMGITLNRDFDGVPMSKKICIVAAGNLEGGLNTPIIPALMNRLGALVLTLEPEEWLDWARGTDEGKEEEGPRVDSWITSFIESDLSSYREMRPVIEDNKPFPSWRAFHKLSQKMRYIESKHEAYRAKRIVPEVNMFEEIAYEAAMLCGVDWAQDFMIFIGYTSKFNIEQIIKDPAQFIEEHLKESENAGKPGVTVTPKDKRVLKRGRIYAFITWLANKVGESFKEIESEPTYTVRVKGKDGIIRERKPGAKYEKGDITLGVKSDEIDKKTLTKNTATVLAFAKAFTEVLSSSDDKIVLKDCVFKLIGGDVPFGRFTSALSQICRNTGIVDIEDLKAYFKNLADDLIRIEVNPVSKIETPKGSEATSSGSAQTFSVPKNTTSPATGTPKNIKTFTTTPRGASKPTTAQATSTASKSTNKPMGQYGLF